MRALALVASLTVLSLVALPRTARADDVDTCANAYESAQRLHQKSDARALVEANACARDVCPDVLRKECAGWVKEWTPAEKPSEKVVAKAEAPKASVNESQPSAIETSRPIPILAYALGGSGIVALGVAGGFALSGLSQRSELERSGCEPNCAPDRVESAKTSFFVADVLAVTGLVALGGAFVVYLTRPEGTTESKAAVGTRSRVEVTPVFGVGAAGVRGTF